MKKQIKNKLSSLLLSTLMLVSSVTPTTVVKAETVSGAPDDKGVATDQTTETQPTQSPAPSQTPASTPSDATQKVEGSTSDVVTPTPSEQTDIVDEAKAEPAQQDDTDQKDEVQGEGEKPTNTFKNEIEPSLATGVIEANGNVIFLIGNLENENFAKTHDAYHEVAANRGIEGYVYSVDINKVDQDALQKLLSYAYRREDMDALQAAYEAKSGVIIYTYNGTITNVISHDKLNENYTISEIASREITANFEMPKSDDYRLFAVEEGKTWTFNAKASLQEFTAPENGYYEVLLRGADGDSDSGAETSGYNKDTVPHTTGVAGGGATVTGTIYLNKGETVYLALGFRNGMSGKTSYNGGGAGFGQDYSFRAGGGGAAALYLSREGDGQLVNYKNKQDQVLMVAGGGGGAEDFYATGNDKGYYCLWNACETSYGANAGSEGLTGRGSGPYGVTGGYSFGIGESYGSYENASAGAGGGGWYGGTSPHDDSRVLRGGSGGGGTSYINTSIVQNGVMQDGQNVEFTWNGKDGFDDGINAYAKISLKSYQSYPLTIHYKSKIDGSTVAKDYTGTYKYGDTYSIDSPNVQGLTVVDIDQQVVKGTMPDEAVEITVYYDYPGLKIHYLDKETGESVANSVDERIMIGKEYSYTSPNVDDYVFYDNDHNVIAGVKAEHDEEFIVYYVKKFNPSKHIIELNGNAVDQKSSDAGVQLSDGDVVKYEIRYENKRGVSINETIIDELPKVLTYVNGSANVEPTINGNQLKWNITIEPETSGAIQFEAKVDANADATATTVDNWTRKDPLIRYSVTKASNVDNDGYIGYDQVVEYKLIVKNEGKQPVTNIKVVDSIPQYTEYVSHSKDYEGTYDKTNGYIHWLIPELKADSVITLSFKVRVTQQLMDDSQLDVINVARYINDETNETTFDDIIHNGKETNEIIHHIVGPKIDVVKSSNPTNMSRVNPGQVIHYNIDLVNNGTVASNYIRVNDLIPEGTSYVENSVLMISENDEANNKYAHSYGDQFDIGYDFKTDRYYLENTDVQAISTSKTLYRVTYETEEWVKKTGNHGGYLWGSNKNDVYTGTSWYPRTGHFGFTARNVKGWVEGSRFPVNEYGDDGISNRWRIYQGNGALVSPSNYTESSGRIYFQTNSTPITYIEAQIYQGDLRKGSNIADKYWYYLCADWRITEWEQLTRTQKKTGWQFDESYPDGSKYISTETQVTNSYVSGVRFNLPNGVSVDTASIPDGWSYNANKGAYQYNGTITTENLNSFLRSVRFVGNYGSVGNIDVIIINTTDINNDGKITSSDDQTTYSTVIPTPENTGACKYVTTNGEPYVECLTHDLNPGQKTVMSFDVIIDNPLDPSIEKIENTALYESLWSDPGKVGTITMHPANESNTVTHLVNQKSPNITANKESNPISGSTVGNLKDIVYTINVTNNGDANANYTVVREYIPEYTTYKPNSISDNGVYVDGEHPYVEWVIYDIAAGHSKSVNYTVTVNINAPASAEIRRNALYELLSEDPIAAGLYDKDPVNVTNETVHYLVPPTAPGIPDIRATKSSNPADGTAIERMKEIQYTIDVRNDGNYPAGQTLVEDVIPEGTTLKSIDEVTGGTNSQYFDVFHKVYTLENDGEDKIRWVIKGLEGGDSVKLKFTVTIDKETLVSSIENIANYDIIDNIKFDEITMDNIDNVDTPVVVTNKVKHPLIEPEINVIKSSDPETDHVVGLGHTITYTLTVANTSTAIANYANIEDVLPNEVMFTENSIVTTNEKDNIVYNATTNSIQGVLYDLQPGEARTIEFKVTVKNSARMGDEIQNVGLYDCSITSKGDAGKPSFTTPTNQTNEIIHVIEIHTDVLPTGGQGVDRTTMILGAIVIFVGCGIFFCLNKKKKD